MRSRGGLPYRRAGRCAVLVLLTVQLGAGGLAICRTDAGHAAVESAWSGCCRVAAPTLRQACVPAVSGAVVEAGSLAGCALCTDASFDLATAAHVTTPQAPPMTSARPACAIADRAEPRPPQDLIPHLARLQTRVAIASTVLTI